MFTEEYKKNCDDLSNVIIGCAIEVHKQMGPGLLESAYESCLCHELTGKNIGVKRQELLPINYKGEQVDAGYRIDILVNDLVIVELKTVESILPVHRAQIMTYLKLSTKWLGLLINFNVKLLKQGIERIVNG
jgi:GxxExxY protein